MHSLLLEVLDKINLGIVIVNSHYEVVVWNKWMVDKTKRDASCAINRPIADACPKFHSEVYFKLLKSTMETGQARFLSGAVHGAFFLKEQPDSKDIIRHNLQLQSLTIEDELFVMIQVQDITSQYQKVQQMRNFIKNLETENDEIKQTEVHSRHLAMTDPLTGLANRLHFMNQISHHFDLSCKNPVRAAIIFLDLDDFKQINDQYGHGIGDMVLRETARRLKETLRGSDLIARIGGDEFTIFIDNVASRKDLLQIAEKILRAFDLPYVFEDRNMKISTSFGIGIMPQDGSNMQEVLDKADLALYQVKKAGKGGYAFYSDSSCIHR